MNGWLLLNFVKKSTGRTNWVSASFWHIEKSAILHKSCELQEIFFAARSRWTNPCSTKYFIPEQTCLIIPISWFDENSRRWVRKNSSADGCSKNSQTIIIGRELKIAPSNRRIFSLNSRDITWRSFSKSFFCWWENPWRRRLIRTSRGGLALNGRNVPRWISKAPVTKIIF